MLCTQTSCHLLLLLRCKWTLKISFPNYQNHETFVLSLPQRAWCVGSTCHVTGWSPPLPPTQVYEGHTGMVRCVDIEPLGQWVASGEVPLNSES